MDEIKNGVIIDEYDGLAENEGGGLKVLRQFKPKSIKAQEWIDDLVRYGFNAVKKRRTAEDLGFFMSDEMPQTGVLSVAPALSALLSELDLLNGEEKESAEDLFETKLDDKPIKNCDKTVLAIVVESVSKLIYECYPKGVAEYSDNTKNVLFSSMPFFDDPTPEGNSIWKGSGYLDAASWVFLAADCIERFIRKLEISAPSIYKNQKWKVTGTDYTETISTEEVKKAVRNMYLSAVQVTCDCIVRNSDGKVLGWSFRPMKNSCAEPSLYFSYVASTVYLGLYKRFDGANGKIQKLRAFEDKLQSIEQELLGTGLEKDRELSGEVKNFAFFKDITNPAEFKKKQLWLTQKKFERYKEFKEFAEFLKELSEEEKQELDFLYNKINNGQPLTYKFRKLDDPGCFTLLKTSTVSLAETLWNEGFGGANTEMLPFKKHMAKGPCFQDGTPIDLSVVRQSNHNNSFFNNLFVIGIVINSAYDETLKAQNYEEYEKMLNAFQLSIQNTQRCYNEIEDDGFLYKIDSYILEFAEKADPQNTELSKQLRKVNMAVLPLMPLLLKNNNLMNEYLVKYPQKEMKDSLKAIIRNKKVSKDKSRVWVWDKDGYNAITNYYYVDALIAFYRYYETYEAPLIGNEENYTKKIDKEVKKAVNEKETEIRILKEDRAKSDAEKDKQIGEMRSVFKGLARLVLNEIIDIVDEQLSPEKLIGNLTEEERKNRPVVEKLNSIDKDTDEIKVSKLVHISEKLQLLSLLTMRYDEEIKKVIQSADSRGSEVYANVLEEALGKEDGSSNFLRNLIMAFTKNNISGNGGTDDKN
ncbi:MAG: hypothetical protein K2H30_02455 [Clostridia bacterium]|nr:hypothetical protein [Clostridia bacterium]